MGEKEGFTLKQFKAKKPGEILGYGEFVNSTSLYPPKGAYISSKNVGAKMLWIASKGLVRDEWTLRIGWAEEGLQRIKDSGREIMFEDTRRAMFPVSDEVNDLYVPYLEPLKKPGEEG